MEFVGCFKQFYSAYKRRSFYNFTPGSKCSGMGLYIFIWNAFELDVYDRKKEVPAVKDRNFSQVDLF